MVGALRSQRGHGEANNRLGLLPGEVLLHYSEDHHHSSGAAGNQQSSSGHSGSQMTKQEAEKNAKPAEHAALLQKQTPDNDRNRKPPHS